MHSSELRNMEIMAQQELEAKKKEEFEHLYNEVLNSSEEGVINIQYNLTYPKEDLLKFLVENKNTLFHGSPNQNIEILEPRQANDRAKDFGNKLSSIG